MKIAEIIDPHQSRQTLTLYHGTTPDAAQSLVTRGWQPNQWGRGGNMGQTRYLYLTTGIEDAEWFANEKGAGTVVAVVNVPLAYLISDPEDAMTETVEDELASAARLGLPAKLALIRPLGPEHFRIVRP
jgi:hypothetical protein